MCQILIQLSSVCGINICNLCTICIHYISSGSKIVFRFCCNRNFQCTSSYARAPIGNLPCGICTCCRKYMIATLQGYVCCKNTLRSSSAEDSTCKPTISNNFSIVLAILHLHRTHACIYRCKDTPCIVAALCRHVNITMILAIFNNRRAICSSRTQRIKNTTSIAISAGQFRLTCSINISVINAIFYVHILGVCGMENTTNIAIPLCSFKRTGTDFTIIGTILYCKVRCIHSPDNTTDSTYVKCCTYADISIIYTILYCDARPTPRCVAKNYTACSRLCGKLNLTCCMYILDGTILPIVDKTGCAGYICISPDKNGAFLVAAFFVCFFSEYFITCINIKCNYLIIAIKCPCKRISCFGFSTCIIDLIRADTIKIICSF